MNAKTYKEDLVVCKLISFNFLRSKRCDGVGVEEAILGIPTPRSSHTPFPLEGN